MTQTREAAHAVCVATATCGYCSDSYLRRLITEDDQTTKTAYASMCHSRSCKITDGGVRIEKFCNQHATDENEADNWKNYAGS